MSELSRQPRLAVLIDADNITQTRLAEALIEEVAKYGVASVKRIYGDWTTPNLRGWKDVLVGLAIQPIQQFSYVSGKNATDSAMIIDAMDLLYTNRFDGFCLVSSDSDFTRLASRIRETGLTVYGFGERKTPQSFVSACDRFVYVDVLRGVGETGPAKPAAPAAANSSPAQTAASGKAATKRPSEATPGETKSAPSQNAELLRLLREAVDDAAGDDGWAGLGAVGSLIAKRTPNFDSRNYGFKKLSDLIPTLGVFQVEKRGDAGKPKAIYLKQKASKPSASTKASEPASD